MPLHPPGAGVFMPLQTVGAALAAKLTAQQNSNHSVGMFIQHDTACRAPVTDSALTIHRSSADFS